MAQPEFQQDVAAGGRALAIGHRLALIWVIVAGVLWASVFVPSALADDGCPDSPLALSDLIALDESPGPLSVAFRPVYGTYGERARACFDDQELRLTGFVARPEGLGGVDEFTIEPTWFVSRAHSLAATSTVDPDIGPVGPFMAVAVPPALEATFSGFEGRWVDVAGHFNDPAASTCVVTMGTPGPEVPTAEQAIAICEASFVVTSVRPALPPTDAAAVSAPTAGEPRDLVTWLCFLGGVVVGAVAGLRNGRSAALPGQRAAGRKAGRRRAADQASAAR